MNQENRMPSAPRPLLISRDIIIAAPPSAVFSALANPHRHADFDGSGTVKNTVSGPVRLNLGDTFKTAMKLFGVHYRIVNTVVEFEADRRIAWCHPGKHRWRYELDEVDGDTRVTETCDLTTSPVRGLLVRTPWPRWNAEGIEKTLPRLKALVENGA
ncbi:MULTISPECIES: SRPBCC family protein [unclassified Saccharopolyspora]|uniref:SRPBCC family protein n=2 Tax=Saccharopolyspora TaxID=1835 RepID=UPI001CD3D894|nr:MULTISPECIES: SRPBCC family protein [unclassified Saccharopolyspora]MCA1189937.1 SRPBCC family protein [Saccharopolyspora sp. 6T]MCA1278254.1 SRPBCC family protein [Saccharopolyspora sp. 7B]